MKIEFIWGYIMKKVLAILLLLFSIILAGCSDTKKLNPDNPVTLTMWHVHGSQTQSTLNDAIDDFNNTEGKKKGVIVKVLSVSDSAKIDKALQASINREPGAAPLPHLFTAYARVYNNFPAGQLLEWDKYFSKEELAQYNQDFLKAGYVGEHLYMLPIAKSTDILFLNKTGFDRFTAATGIGIDKLAHLDDLLVASHDYFVWSGGKDLIQMNDYYNYFLMNMASVDDEFIQNGRLNVHSPNFERFFRPIARAALTGGLCIATGYSSTRWKTGEILMDIGSSAGLMYLREYITYLDNTREEIEMVLLPYPFYKGTKPVLLQRGTDLMAVKNQDERYNEGAAVFAKWISQKEHNLPFVSTSGYLPAHNDAFEELFAHPEKVEIPKYRKLYTMMAKYNKNIKYLYLPQYKDNYQVQTNFERDIRAVLNEQRARYMQMMAIGTANEEVLEQLIQESLYQVINMQ